MEQATVVRTEQAPVADIRPHPKNARRGDTATIERSLREHGQYAPIIVHEDTGYVLKGNHTFRILRDKLGADTVLATFVRCTEDKALAILAVDNKSSDGAGYDDQALLQLLEELNDADLLTSAGYSDTDLDDLAALFEEQASQAEQPAPEPGSVLDGGLGEDPETPSSVSSDASGIQPAKSLADLGAKYDQQATRMLLLNYPIAQFTWVVEKLETLGEKYGLDNNADVVLRALSEVTGEAAPEAAEEE